MWPICFDWERTGWLGYCIAIFFSAGLLPHALGCFFAGVGSRFSARYEAPFGRRGLLFMSGLVTRGAGEHPGWGVRFGVDGRAAALGGGLVFLSPPPPARRKGTLSSFWWFLLLMRWGEYFRYAMGLSRPVMCYSLCLWRCRGLIGGSGVWRLV